MSETISLSHDRAPLSELELPEPQAVDYIAGPVMVLRGLRRAVQPVTPASERLIDTAAYPMI
jgi:hypothetical protein